MSSSSDHLTRLVDITVYTEDLISKQPCTKNHIQYTANSDVNVLDINLGEVFLTPDQQEFIIDTVCPPPPPPVPSQMKPVIASSIPSKQGSLGVKLTWDPAENTSKKGLGIITSYTITSEPALSGGAETVPAPLTSLTIYGLSSDSQYIFFIVATNGVGSSTPSLASIPYSPSPIPSLPRNVVLTALVDIAGDNSISLSWDPPEYNAETVTGYIVKSLTNNTQETLDSLSRSTKIKGVQVGEKYKYSVIAISDNGNSKAGYSNEVTAISSPSVPQGIYGISGDANLTAYWTSPQSAGGSSIVSYIVSPEPLPPGYTPVTVTVTDQEKKIYFTMLYGLSNGSSYSIKVKAVSSAIVDSTSLFSEARSLDSYLVCKAPIPPSIVLAGGGVGGVVDEEVPGVDVG